MKLEKRGKLCSGGAKSKSHHGCLILMYLEVLMNPNISILVIVNVVSETIDHVIDNLV